ncbi:MAG: heavy-metal-associated domain-containing protein [Syntrophobacterales bacterium]|nr:heavy-metal-associated domain-containing protein [Syntrophobacterales bacterium]
MEQIVKVKGMSCQHCAKMVTKALQGVKDVKGVEVSLERAEAKLEVEEPIDISILREVLKKAGYEIDQ